MPAEAPPAKPKITVPKMTELTAPAPAHTDAPNPAPKGSEPPKEEPVPPNPPAPPVSAVPLDFITENPNPAPGTPQKTDAQFAADRRRAKEERVDLQEITRQYDEAKVQIAQRDTELQQLRDQLAASQKTFDETKKLAETRATEIEDLRGRYVTDHTGQFDANADEILSGSTTKMLAELRGKLPPRIKNKEGNNAIVFFDALLANSANQQGLMNVLGAYHTAMVNHNEASANLAVNALATWLGADVDITPEDPQKRRLLPTDDPTFQAIETAMRAALPHFQDRITRYGEIQRDGPKLAQQQYSKREGQIRQTLSDSIFLTKDAALERLKVDSVDSLGLFAQIVPAVPELKAIVDAKLASYSEAFAAVGSNVSIPMTGNDPNAIRAHQEKVSGIRTQLSEIMRNAVIGATIGPVLAQLITERDAAEARADAAASNANPGPPGGNAGGAGNPPKAGAPTDFIQ